MKIVEAAITDAKTIAGIISKSNRDVAFEFGLNFMNCPKHPSFCTEQWVLNDFNNGVTYFLFQSDGVNIGCVSYQKGDEETAFLNRLSVLPEYRGKGAGEQLVKHIFAHSKKNYLKKISIGIIAAHQKLKKWYCKLGFRELETKQFPHLPFEVTYMSFEL